MEEFHKMDLIKSFAYHIRKWGIYISTTEQADIVGLNKAVPFLSKVQCFNLMDGFLFLTFDTEKEMEDHFDMIVDEHVQVYALTCSNTGEFLDENT